MARVLITGASRGLATVLSQRGHEVIASARHTTDLVDLEATSKMALDVTSPASIAAALVVEGPVEVVQSMFETNVSGQLRVVQAVLPSMRERQHGMIVSITSPAAQFAPPLQGIYSATKIALERLSEALWFETRHFGMRVVVVASGGIRTGILTSQSGFRSIPTHPWSNSMRGVSHSMPHKREERHQSRSPALSLICSTRTVLPTGYWSGHKPRNSWPGFVAGSRVAWQSLA